MMIILLSVSCSQDDNVETEIQEQDIYTTKDALLKDLTKRLSVLLKEEEVREFLKNEVNKQFDGDYNVLAIEALQKQLKIKEESLSFGNHLLAISSQNQISFENLITYIGNHYPLLQIKIPDLGEINSKDWDTEKEVPIVAFISSNGSEDHILAYDQYGNEITLSKTQQPTELVVVLNENERVKVIAQSEIENKIFCSKESSVPYYKYSNTNFFLKEKLSECINFPIKIGSHEKSSGCDRDRRAGKDKIKRVKFNNKTAFNNAKDGWFDGGLELKLTVFFGQANGAISQISKNFYTREKDMKTTKWLNLDVEIVNWDKTIYGDAMLYSWVEEDPGDPVEIKSGFTSKFDDNTTQSFEIKKTVTDKDDILGESVVEYCDATGGYGHLYNTGTVQFQVNQNEYDLAYEDEYLVGDWDGDGRDNIAVRRSNQIIMDYNYDGISDFSFFFGLGNQDDYLVGDWDGDGRDNIAVRRSNGISMDYNFDGVADKIFYFGSGDSEDEYLSGDWNKDGRDNIGIRKNQYITMNLNFDNPNIYQTVSYGNGNQEDQYLIGDFNGDNTEDIAVRRENQIIIDYNMDGTADQSYFYGLGNSEDEYLVGDWNGDGKDNIAVRKGNTILMNYDVDTTPDFTYIFGLGTN